MATRHLSRLIIGLSALAFLVGLLLSGSTTSAAKGDKSAPTAPANLVVTAITETSISLSWKAATDNSERFSYRVRITNLNNSAPPTVIYKGNRSLFT